MQPITLNLPTLPAGGYPAYGEPAMILDLLPHKSVQASGTFTATLQLQGSNDGTNWSSIGDAITQAGFYAVTTVMMQIRVAVTAYTTGTPVLVLAGLRQAW